MERSPLPPLFNFLLASLYVALSLSLYLPLLFLSFFLPISSCVPFVFSPCFAQIRLRVLGDVFTKRKLYNSSLNLSFECFHLNQINLVHIVCLMVVTESMSFRLFWFDGKKSGQCYCSYRTVLWMHFYEDHLRVVQYVDLRGLTG